MNREFMRRKILIAGVCATYLIAGCSQNKVNNDSDTAQPPIISDMDTPSTLSEENNLADIETTLTSSPQDSVEPGHAEESITEGQSSNNGLTELILLPEHPVLSKVPFFAVSLGDVLSGDSYTESYSAKSEHGYLHFFEDTGITYITGEPSGTMDNSVKRIRGVIITDETYKFSCGLKVGMTVSELMDMPVLFNDSSLVTMMNYSYLPLVKDKMDYDNIYITSIVMERGKDYTYQGLVYSYIKCQLLAFVKDSRVIAVSVDDAVGNLHDFSITELFVPEHPLFNDKFFQFVSMKELEEEFPDFQYRGTHEGTNATTTYYYTPGMEYATLGGMDGGVTAILITDGTYSLGCGLQVGSDESEIQKLCYPDVEEWFPGGDSMSVVDIWNAEEVNSIFHSIDYDKIYAISMLNFNPFEFRKQYRDLGYEKQAELFSGGQSSMLIYVKGGRIVALGTSF